MAGVAAAATAAALEAAVTEADAVVGTGNAAAAAMGANATAGAGVTAAMGANATAGAGVTAAMGASTTAGAGVTATTTAGAKPAADAGPGAGARPAAGSRLSAGAKASDAALDSAGCPTPECTTATPGCVAAAGTGSESPPGAAGAPVAAISSTSSSGKSSSARSAGAAEIVGMFSAACDPVVRPAEPPTGIDGAVLAAALAAAGVAADPTGAFGFKGFFTPAIALATASGAFAPGVAFFAEAEEVTKPAAPTAGPLAGPGAFGTPVGREAAGAPPKVAVPAGLPDAVVGANLGVPARAPLVPAEAPGAPIPITPGPAGPEAGGPTAPGPTKPDAVRVPAGPPVLEPSPPYGAGGAEALSRISGSINSVDADKVGTSEESGDAIGA